MPRAGHRLLLHFSNIVLIVAGYIDGDMNGTIGPFDPPFTFLGGVCLSLF